MRSNQKHHSSVQHLIGRRGMTLIEVIVVLGLLVALASVALTTLDGISDRSRMDTTRNRLDMIERAIVGDGLEPGRFISDMGRLPITLDELWTVDDSLKTDVKTVSLSTESWCLGGAAITTLECGWRGPYVQVSGDTLYDGFGNTFGVFNRTTTSTTGSWPTLPDNWIIEVAGYGRDGEAEGDEGWENADDFRTIREEQVLASLNVRILVRDSLISPDTPTNDSCTWTSPRYELNGSDAVADRAKTTQYAQDYVVRAGGTGNYPDVPTDKYNQADLFICTATEDANGNGAKTGSGDPSSMWSRWQAISDGEITWRYLLYTRRMNRMRVSIISPYVPSGAGTVQARRITALWNDSAAVATLEEVPALTASDPDISAEWSGMGNITFFGLTPGIRKLFVYGALLVGSNATNAYSSGLQTIELKPGANYITVYLTEPLQ